MTANFRQVVKEGELQMHPHIGGPVEGEIPSKKRQVAKLRQVAPA
ncbi:hypothetical protein OU426_12580 [Frigidibacter sp. RF13]|nr:hypothetical protein [Frigidibacter sp. RF13]MCY1127692.1 hypothetical protein [Frigidibacter sp. RF13]